MLVMQYQLNLPVGFDVAGLRKDIPDIGRHFDALPGLALKAFLLREKGRDDSPVNQYAPFYAWSDDTAAASFLYNGGGFGGVVGHFGRPVVQTWVGGTFQRGVAHGEPVTHAVRTLTRVTSDVDPAKTAAAVQDTLAARLQEPGLVGALWAIDPRTWELLTFTLHSELPEAGGGELYDVPHLSAPELGALPSELA